MAARIGSISFLCFTSLEWGSGTVVTRALAEGELAWEIDDTTRKFKYLLKGDGAVPGGSGSTGYERLRVQYTDASIGNLALLVSTPGSYMGNSDLVAAINEIRTRLEDRYTKSESNSKYVVVPVNDSYVLKSALNSAGYLTSTSLAGYAKETWVAQYYYSKVQAYDKQGTDNAIDGKVGTLTLLRPGLTQTDLVSAANDIDGKIGTLTLLRPGLTQTDLVSAANDIDGKIGVLTQLAFGNHSDLVSAANDLDTRVKQNKTDIGDLTNLRPSLPRSDLVSAAIDLDTRIGILTSLNNPYLSALSSLVSVINAIDSWLDQTQKDVGVLTYLDNPVPAGNPDLVSVANDLNSRIGNLTQLNNPGLSGHSDLVSAANSLDVRIDVNRQYCADTYAPIIAPHFQNTPADPSAPSVPVVTDPSVPTTTDPDSTGFTEPLQIATVKLFTGIHNFVMDTAGDLMRSVDSSGSVIPLEYERVLDQAPGSYPVFREVDHERCCPKDFVGRAEGDYLYDLLMETAGEDLRAIDDSGVRKYPRELDTAPGSPASFRKVDRRAGIGAGFDDSEWVPADWDDQGGCSWVDLGERIK